MGTSTEQYGKLAKRYRAGQCTPEEIEQIRRWYNSFEENGYPLPPDTEIERASNEAAIWAINKLALQQRRTKIKKLLFPVLKVAAVLMLVLSATILIYNYNKRNVAVKMQEISALAGQKKQITLADGTEIFLNGASSIRYPEKFVGTVREISLEGEAFFKVAHNKEQPFIVRTEKLGVKVLGTSFDVKAYQKDEQVTVAVATGKVAVSNISHQDQQLMMLNPGERLNFDKVSGSFAKEQVKVQQIGKWQYNRLDFDFETLENIIKELERNYGVSFIIKDRSILKQRIRLSVDNESLPNILKLLSRSADGFSYKIIRNQVFIQ